MCVCVCVCAVPGLELSIDSEYNLARVVAVEPDSPAGVYSVRPEPKAKP
jgi:hypothetical protein